MTQQQEIRRLIASPDVLVGSVHAITEQGQILIASAVGSQLGPAAAGARSVVWVVGTQKLVHTLDEGFRRVQEYSYSLEDARTRQVYGQGSRINKPLIVNGEHLPGRVYITPVNAQATPDGFVVPMTFGEQSDWFRNVQATGGCVIRWNGVDYPVVEPEIINWAIARSAFSPLERLLVPLIGIQQFVRLRHAPAKEHAEVKNGGAF